VQSDKDITKIKRLTFFLRHSVFMLHHTTRALLVILLKKS